MKGSSLYGIIRKQFKTHTDILTQSGSCAESELDFSDFSSWTSNDGN